jgi:hypothetical protein
MALNEIVNEMKLKRDINGQNTMVVKEEYYGHKDLVLVNQGPHNNRNNSEVNQRQTSHIPGTSFEKYSTPARIQIKGTPIVDKKDADIFDRRFEAHSNRGKHVKDICSLNVSNYLQVSNYNIILLKKYLRISWG